MYSGKVLQHTAYFPYNFLNLLNFFPCPPRTPMYSTKYIHREVILSPYFGDTN